MERKNKKVRKKKQKFSTASGIEPTTLELGSGPLIRWATEPGDYDVLKVQYNTDSPRAMCPYVITLQCLSMHPMLIRVQAHAITCVVCCEPQTDTQTLTSVISTSAAGPSRQDTTRSKAKGAYRAGSAAGSKMAAGDIAPRGRQTAGDIGARGLFFFKNKKAKRNFCSYLKTKKQKEI